MKIKESVRKSLVASFKLNIKKLNDVMKEYMIAMKEALTVEELMEAKKQMLIELISHFPLGTQNCYFCSLEDNSVIPFTCNRCLYGKVHGKCTNHDSDYAKMFETYQNLKSCFEKYYGGETYSKNVKKRK